MKVKNILIFLFTIIFAGNISSQTINSFSEGEFMVDTKPVYTPGINQAVNSAVATDSTNFLVVWSEESHIYGALVSWDGLIIKQHIQICIGSEYQAAPDVAFDGTNFLVVWLEGEWYATDICASRVTTEGTVLDTGIVICNSPELKEDVSVSSNGINSFVTWTNHHNEGDDIYGARLDQNGNVLDINGIPICKVSESDNKPKSAFDGINYLVIWERHPSWGQSDIYGTIVTPEGVVLDTSGFAIVATPREELDIDLIFGSSIYLITWKFSAGIYAARVNTSGSMIDTAGISVCGPYYQGSPVVSFDGTNFLVVYNRTYQDYYNVIFGVKINQSGQILPGGKLLCPLSNIPGREDLNPQAAFNGTDYLITWAHDDCSESPSCFQIYGNRVSKDMTVLDNTGILISNYGFGFFPQWDASAAFDGENYVVVWEDCRVPQSGDIYGSVISPDLTMKKLIRISDAEGWQWAPSIAYGNSQYLIVWEDDRNNADIYGCRINSEGEILYPGEFIICNAGNDQQYPAAAFDGENFLVAWRDKRNGNDFNIYASRVTPGGVVMDPNGIEVSSLYGDDGSPSVAFDGANFMVAWETPEADINGARITPAGIVLDPNGFQISANQLHQENPAITFDGINYFVVWDDGRNSSGDIYGARITTAGTVLDPNGIPVCSANGVQENASVIFSGANYLITWDDYRNNPDTADIYCSRVAPDGSLLNETPLVTGTDDQYYASLAKGNGTEILIAFNGWAGMYQGFNMYQTRIWGKFVGDPTGINDPVSFPSEFTLNQNYPNPFNPVTRIDYSLPKTSRVVLKIYDILGNEVVTLIDEEKPAGYYEITWNAADLSSGVYFCRLKAGGYVRTRKMVLMK